MASPIKRHRRNCAV
jgi:hypothetical protein